MRLAWQRVLGVDRLERGSPHTVHHRVDPNRVGDVLDVVDQHPHAESADTSDPVTVSLGTNLVPSSDVWPTVNSRPRL
jgi:hypothetical protein